MWTATASDLPGVWLRWWVSGSPSPKLGRMALAHWQARSAGRRSCYARLGSRSALGATPRADPNYPHQHEQGTVRAEKSRGVALECAAETLRAAHASGVRVIVDGESLVVEESSPPPGAVLVALLHHKSAIVAQVRLRKVHRTLTTGRRIATNAAGSPLRKTDHRVPKRRR